MLLSRERPEGEAEWWEMGGGWEGDGGVGGGQYEIAIQLSVKRSSSNAVQMGGDGNIRGSRYDVQARETCLCAQLCDCHVNVYQEFV